MIEIAYGSHPRQTFDWYPASVSPGTLTVLAIHAGGWCGGDKRDYANLHPSYVNAFLAEGWAVACMNYRYSTDAPWPAQLEDAKEVLAAVRTLTGGPVVIFAESSGGQIALELLNGGSVEVAGLCALYPVTDLTQVSAQSTASPNPWPAWLAALMPSGNCADASPALHVNSGLPPVLLIHGTADPMVSLAQSHAYAAASRVVGNRALTVPVIGAGHGTSAFVAPALLDLVISFFKGAVWPH